jgi:hypothetical protein
MQLTERRRIAPALAGALLIAAVGLWLSGGGVSHAATATNTQSVSVTVNNAISWGTSGACVQSMGAAAFGSLSPGSSATAPGVGVFTGCVTSNATWGVTGTMTTAPTSGANTLGAANFRAEVATVPLLADAAACPVGNSLASCTLDNSGVTLVSNAPTTPLVGTLLNNGFTFDYKVSVPNNQPSGAYTGGLITLTAAN